MVSTFTGPIHVYDEVVNSMVIRKSIEELDIAITLVHLHEFQV